MLDNRDSSIVSGSFVNMEITVRRPELLSVPIQALLSKDGKPALYIARLPEQREWLQA